MTERTDDLLRQIISALQPTNGKGGGDRYTAPVASPLIDPTLNVKELVELKVQHQTALREADSCRQDDLRTAETFRLNERFTIESAHHLAVQQVEARRLDSIFAAETRRVDALLTAAAGAVTLASTRQELTATALAERVDTSAKALAERVDASAKTLAATVEATAKASDIAVQSTNKTLSDRIEPLERFRYESAGRSGVSTPLLLMMGTIGGGILAFAIERAFIPVAAAVQSTPTACQGVIQTIAGVLTCVAK